MDDDSITPHYQSTLKLYQKACKLRDDAQRMAGYLDGEPAPEHHAALHNFQHARAMALVIISQCRAGKLVEALELHAHAVEVIERAYSQLKDEPAKRGHRTQKQTSIDLIETARQINREMVVDKRSQKDRIAEINKRTGKSLSWMNKNKIWKQ